MVMYPMHVVFDRKNDISLPQISSPATTTITVSTPNPARAFATSNMNSQLTGISHAF